ncbi:restriction endonuclease subunit S [Fusobacterium pseudoperiodonticum]|uniref:restriction endonuclease subunit S n=1 Tax=Fusobacterium pseudoperiodonticum TaxID=2663009 RepID=UPI000C1BAE51|nr:restriction endonuclease subunit S [Fusobacterium pseudoperiodonticum]ATV73068.1 restriction endonuclease subunit S [Fusobacterium pseudoperiodonticum]
MAENTKKPAIRFAGFSEAWEQRKLGDIGKCQSGIGFPDAEQGGKIGIPFYKVSDMNNYGNEQEMTCANNYVTDEQIIRKNWKPIMEVPAVIFAKVGAAIMLNRKRLCHFPFLLDNNTMAYKFGEKWDTNFGKTLFEKIDLTELVQVGALPSYNATDVENIDIKIPTDMNEQRVLGQYFSNLDNLITLHQRKYEKLSNVKKSMLEKMFPKNGSNVPEIRFKGFTEAWEQCKLDTITDVRDGTHDSPQYVEDGHPFITSKNVKDGFINYEDIQYVSDKDYEEINKRSKVDKNDILMGMIGTIGNIALVRETPDFAIKNVALIKDIGEVFYHYLYHCLQSNSVAHQLDENLDGGTQKFIALNKIRELVIPVPSEYEQHKIGDYMELLDKLITLHQRKLEKLKNIKKSMLEKMFI